jgi:hypothetical protein
MGREASMRLRARELSSAAGRSGVARREFRNEMSWWRARGVRRAMVEAQAGVPMVSREELGESRLWPTLAVLTAAALYATLPTRFIAGTAGSGVYTVVRWLVPVLTVLLLAPLVLQVPDARLLRSAQERTAALRLSRRIASRAVLALVSAANAAAIILLVHFLVAGVQTNARLLLRAGIHMWCMNVLVFALWFWQLDGGGPIQRHLDPTGTAGRDFLFPQQADPEAGRGWQPTFVDYLYVAYTNATAFSPTDAMPLSKWAKVLMLVQSAASLLLAITVIARAVNILK